MFQVETYKVVRCAKTMEARQSEVRVCEDVFQFEKYHDPVSSSSSRPNFFMRRQSVVLGRSRISLARFLL